MFRFFPLLFVVLALVSSHVVFGAPSCSHDMKKAGDCITKCRNKLGWPGSSTTTETPSVQHPKPKKKSPASSPSPSPSPSPTHTSTTTQQPSPSPSPTPTTQKSSASGSSSNVSANDISTYLSAHNTVRAQHGASDLTWSDELSNKAQQWANGCVFKHSGGSLGPFGENLAAGTGGGFSITEAIDSWTSEVSQYDPNNPVPSHFTQVVWKSTTQVGCAVQSCSGIFDASFGPAQYYVCEYSPAGNVIGEFPQNVQV